MTASAPLVVLIVWALAADPCDGDWRRREERSSASSASPSASVAAAGVGVNLPGDVILGERVGSALESLLLFAPSSHP